MRSTDGLKVGGSGPTSVACLAESSGLETATYLYLVSRYFGIISVCMLMIGAGPPNIPNLGMGNYNYYCYFIIHYSSVDHIE